MEFKGCVSCVDEKLKVGDIIRVKKVTYLIHSPRTKQWMANEVGEVLAINKKAIAVRFKSYPLERHYVDYGDYDIIESRDEEKPAV